MNAEIASYIPDASRKLVKAVPCMTDVCIALNGFHASSGGYFKCTTRNAASKKAQFVLDSIESICGRGETTSMFHVTHSRKPTDRHKKISSLEFSGF